jgi:excisionase family DNA binding protein
MARLLYSRKEAAEALSLHVNSVDILISSGRLRARRIGSRVLVPAEELERYARRDQGPIWPAKVNGKTVNSFSKSSHAEEASL